MTPRVRRYAEEIAFWHGIAPAELLGRGRSHPLPAARGDVMKRLRREGFSTVQIGRWLDRDHSTVVHWTSPLSTFLSTGRTLDRLNGPGA